MADIILREKMLNTSSKNTTPRSTQDRGEGVRAARSVTQTNMMQK